MIEVLRIVATVGCGLVAGVFFAFSAGVMTALGRLPAARGAAAMQGINTAVLNPVFLGVFVGTALVCAALVVAVLVTGESVGPVVGALLYLVGGFGVTAAANVPMNDALAAVDPESDAGLAAWERYRVRWTAWNHLRTVATAAAVAVLALG